MEAYNDSLLHHRRHLPGRQPAQADHRQGRGRRRQHPQHHRPRRHPRLGRARLRPDRRQRRRPAQRRHRRLGQLRHDPQRARPAVRRLGGLAARRPGRPGRRSTHPSTAAPTPARPATPTADYELASDGSYAKGKLLNTYVSESWEKPTGCTARDVDGNPLVHGVDEDRARPDQETDGICIPAFSQSVAVRHLPHRPGHPRRRRSAPTVNGNYGFGDGCFNGTLDASDPAEPDCTGGTSAAFPAGDYLVEPRHPRRPSPATRSTR